MARYSVLLLFLISLIFFNNGDALIPDGLSKLFGTLATVKNVRIPELLNQLCNESQGANVTRRDACYGCFYRASSQSTGYPLLLAMSTCADMYLNNTDYGHCQVYLRNATNNFSNRVGPITIYCTFLQCIRQVNKDTLLRECVGEAFQMFPNFNLTDVNLSQLFVNTTACVLAKTRCAYMNPITGEIQEDDLTNKFHLPSINAIFVNADYDFNIVQFPYRYGIADICAKFRNIELATWPSVAC
ncbi:uncharacterized protein LOC122517494 [Polistes fuscatus]|uniref:uncharacterized protein LOC122517494 n=1 Tax=Polistes fuscatus TaxID=30207 RepID=UPI001CA82F68|nr:uncharacterized protein LOC122517494 [Polistes fuscatus]